jgi:signal transduction histidine kinase
VGDAFLLTVLNVLLIFVASLGLYRLVTQNKLRRDVHIRLITILTSTVPIRDLLERVSEEIRAAVDARHVSFFVYKPDEHFVSGGTTGYHRPAVVDGHLLESYFKRTKREYVRLVDLLTETDIRRMLKSYQIEFVMPLKRGEDIIGFLFLSKKAKLAYSKADIRMVTDIKTELAIAVQNAVSLDAVKQLNAHLQQRIDASTDQLQRSNDQLRGLDVAKDEFVSMASHQLRTPLTSVKGYISMVLEGDGGKITKMQKQLLGEAFASSERMVHLINDFLNVSRVQTGKFMIDRHEVDFVKLVRQEVSQLKRTAEMRDLNLVMDLPKEPIPMQLDEGKIRQVVMNFIDNAIYYSKPETEITIKVSQTQREVLLEVSDYGIGVPAKQQASLFTKFFRADNARTQRPDGTGVGLYLAKTVIDGHDGSIIFKSKEGQGSTFGFRLPK